MLHFSAGVNLHRSAAFNGPKHSKSFMFHFSVGKSQVKIHL